MYCDTVIVDRRDCNAAFRPQAEAVAKAMYSHRIPILFPPLPMLV